MTKSKAELSAMNNGDIFENVFRTTFIRDITKNKWVLKERADGLPDVTKGHSPVRPYEGQSDGTNTFGYYANAEIWQKD